MSGHAILQRLRSVLGFAFGVPGGYVTAHEVMDRTGASPEKLEEWERRGLLRPYLRIGRNLYRPEQVDVVRWLIREERVRSRWRLTPAGETASPGPGQSVQWPSGDPRLPHGAAWNTPVQQALPGLEGRDRPDLHPWRAQGGAADSKPEGSRRKRRRRSHG